jgi:hypothetical protein
MSKNYFSIHPKPADDLIAMTVLDAFFENLLFMSKRVFYWIFCLLVLSSIAFAQPSPLSFPEFFRVSTLPRDILDPFVWSTTFLGEAPSPLTIFERDLDGDAIPELFVSCSSLRGNAGSMYEIFHQQGKGWAYLGEAFLHPRAVTLTEPFSSAISFLAYNRLGAGEGNLVRVSLGKEGFSGKVQQIIHPLSSDVEMYQKLFPEGSDSLHLELKLNENSGCASGKVSITCLWTNSSPQPVTFFHHPQFFLKIGDEPPRMLVSRENMVRSDPRPVLADYTYLPPGKSFRQTQTFTLPERLSQPVFIGANLDRKRPENLFFHFPKDIASGFSIEIEAWTGEIVADPIPVGLSSCKDSTK